MTVEWVELETVLVAHADQIAEHEGSPGVRDEGALHSALARPQNLAAYGDPDLFQLAAAYADEPFVEVTRGRTPSLADVVGSNRVAVGVAAVAGVSTPMLTVVAAIDNLVKGAAGQAVQNLNLMSGLPETEGLL